MDWIILHCGVSDLLEEVDPPNDLAEEVHNYDRLPALPGKSPFILDASLPCVFGKLKKV